MASIARNCGLLAPVPWLVLLLAPAGAADLVAVSHIDRVTVYPDAAAVQRVARIEAPAGHSTVIYRGLPMGLDPASLRVAGAAGAHLFIGSVETHVAPAAARAAEGTLDARLKQLQGEREAWQATLDALEAKKAMIIRFSQAGPEKLSPDSQPLDIAQWSNAWDAVGQGLAKIGDELRMARGRARDLDEEIRSIEQARQRPAPAATLRDVTVEIDADAATAADLALTYRVAGAGWQPVYDAQLDTTGARPGLELVRRAMVSQRTGEDWSGVALSVSTTRAHRGTQAPDLSTQRVSFYDPRLLAPAPAPMAAARTVGAAQDMRMEKSDAAGSPNSGETAVAPVPAQEMQASLEAGNWQAAFVIPGKVDIPADGATKSFRIASTQLAPELVVRTTAALDETAYLEAKFVNGDDAPLLPGLVNLHRDGAFTGVGRIGFVAAGDSASLGFGADEGVKVTRVPVRIKENDPSWMGSSKTEQREFKTVVHNLHPFAVKVSVTDRMPVSENSAIVIETLPATTPPTEKIVNDRRGVMGWTYDLAPDASREIHFAYRMKWPADREVIFQNVPNGPAMPVSIR